jgi:hypothetical protein
MMYTATIAVIKVQWGYWEAVTTITGPNDVIHVVWAISESFYFIIRVLLLLNNSYRYY